MKKILRAAYLYVLKKNITTLLFANLALPGYIMELAALGPMHGSNGFNGEG